MSGTYFLPLFLCLHQKLLHLDLLHQLTCFFFLSFGFKWLFHGLFTKAEWLFHGVQFMQREQSKKVNKKKQAKQTKSVIRGSDETWFIYVGFLAAHICFFKLYLYNYFFSKYKTYIYEWKIKQNIYFSNSWGPGVVRDPKIKPNYVSGLRGFKIWRASDCADNLWEYQQIDFADLKPICLFSCCFSAFSTLRLCIL